LTASEKKEANPVEVRAATILLALVALAAALAAAAQAQVTSSSNVFIPPSNFQNPLERGLKFHTNYRILLTPGGGLGPAGGMTPAQIRSFYNLPSTGGSNAIAIVVAYHNPTALNDFNVFSAQFGLPQETSTDPLSASNQVFQVVYASGSEPKKDTYWAVEAAIDTQWAHAMAPNAKIVLVEAEDNGSGLFDAVDVASALPNVRDVSMSWGATEYAYADANLPETSMDVHFPPNNGIVYFACSGDVGGVVIYPAASPCVVSCGGTSVQTDIAGNFISETGWSAGGGGPSIYEARPAYQDVIQGLVGAARGTPDICSNADPLTGVSVYSTTHPMQAPWGKWPKDVAWVVIGGTSVAAPCIAGMVNLAGSFRSDSAAELDHMYGDLGRKYFRDITSGAAGIFSCLPGWDFVTGVGSPWGTRGL
jgi:kumamolisin